VFQVFSGRQTNSISDLLACCVLAILLSFPSGERVSRLSRMAKRPVVAVWDWLAKWKVVETIFTVGWGLMLGAHEYLLSLIFLGMAATGAVSTVCHWDQPSKIRKGFCLLGIVGMTGAMTLVTLANKSDQQWSEIPDYLASRMGIRAIQIPVWELPIAPIANHTSKQALLEAQKESDNFLKSRRNPFSVAALDDKSRFEASFTPVTLEQLANSRNNAARSQWSCNSSSYCDGQRPYGSENQIVVTLV